MNWFWMAVVTILVLLATSCWAEMKLRENPQGLGVRRDLSAVDPPRTAPPGSLRRETVQATHAKRTIVQYRRAGWIVTDQLCTTSLGSRRPEFTINFRKV